MANPSEALTFRTQGLEQLDKLLLGETEAKLAILGAMVMGEAVLLSGPPGAGKTTLGEDAYRVIDGIQAENVVTVPIQADLTPQRLIGGDVATTKEINGEDMHYTETNRTQVDPILHEGTQVLFVNEMNRVNPYALNAAMEAYVSRTVSTTAGKSSLKGLEYAIATMNPSDARNGTFPVSAANASRHGLGAILGVDDDKTGLRKGDEKRSRYTQTDIAHNVTNLGWAPKPNQVDAVTDLDTLHDYRETASKLAIPESLWDYAVKLGGGTMDALRTKGVVEARARMSYQIGKIARTLAFLGAESQVQPENLDQAVKYVIASRLGALDRNADQNIEGVYHQALNQ